MKIPNWLISTIYVLLVAAITGLACWVKFERGFSDSTSRQVIDSFPPWFAQSAPSFLYSFGIVMILLAIPTVKRYLALSLGCGALAYEFIQIWMPRRTFTWQDVLATLLGIAAAFAIEAFVSWLAPNFRKSTPTENIPSQINGA